MITLDQNPEQFKLHVASVTDLPTDNQKFKIYHSQIHPWSSSELDQRVNRVSMYVKENQKAFIYQVPGSVGGGVVAGAALGAGIGAATGFLVCNVPGCCAGAIIGAIAGAGTGLVTGGTLAAVLTRNTYIEWKRFRRYEDMIPVLLDMQKNHPSFEDYCCSISNDIFQDPVMLPTGVAYERVELMKYLKFLKSKGGAEGDPMRSMPSFAEKDIYDDYATRGFILIALEKLIKKDVQALKFDSDDHKALTSLLRDLDNQIRTLEIKGRALIQELYKQKIVTAAVYGSYNIKLNELARD